MEDPDPLARSHHPPTRREHCERGRACKTRDRGRTPVRGERPTMVESKGYNGGKSWGRRDRIAPQHRPTFCPAGTGRRAIRRSAGLTSQYMLTRHDVGWPGRPMMSFDPAREASVGFPARTAIPWKSSLPSRGRIRGRWSRSPTELPPVASTASDVTSADRSAVSITAGSSGSGGSGRGIPPEALTAAARVALLLS